ncbi:arginase family protein [Viridibacillus sp. NPDC096237]|uniref:arginase family protein n=1 Tax=Viridibacillus sp. NPDC096237 TaxID=3390721 RepID=UPI003D025D43
MLKLINEVEVKENQIINKIFGNTLEVNDELENFILESINHGLAQTMKNWGIEENNPIVIELIKSGFIFDSEIGLQVDNLHAVVNHSHTFFGVPDGDLYYDCIVADENQEEIYGFISVPYNRGSLVYNIDIESPNYIRAKSNDLFQITLQNNGKSNGYYSTYQKKNIFKDKNIKDYGEIIQKASDTAYLERIEDIACQLMNSYIKPIFIGGDHTITYPIVKGINSLEKEFQVIQIDAHSDFSPLLNPKNATVQHSNIISLISELSNLKQIYQFGLSGFMTHDELLGLTQHSKISSYFRTDFKSLNIDKDLPTYLTIDVDVLDSTLMSAVSYPNVGGWSFDSFMEFIQKQLSGLNIIGVDIVEYDKAKDKDGKGVTVVNNMVLELLGAI